MKLRTVQTLIILVLACGSKISHAQINLGSLSDGTLSLHFGTSLPVGDFRSNDNEQAAAYGLAAGFQFHKPLLQSDYFDYFAGFDVIMNGVRSADKRVIRESLDENSAGLYNLKFPTYFNLPVTLGIRYIHPTRTGNDPYIEGALVANYLKTTNKTLQVSGQKVTTKSDPAINMGYKIGGGLKFINDFFVAMSYCGFGKHDLHTTIIEDGEDDITSSDKLNVSILMFSVGYEY